MISLISSVIDNGIFYLVFGATALIAASQAIARVISVLFNYAAVRNTVFRSGQPHGILLPKYLFLVALNALLSYVGIRFLTSITSIPVVAAKMIAETILFLLNYAAQKVYVFRHSGEQPLS
ncbi:MAG TPA: GtrA family protein [Bryobacteraceae bacterium]|nr:GtrA family protein [Bryobacteraceae bacterium]